MLSKRVNTFLLLGVVVSASLLAALSHAEPMLQELSFEQDNTQALPSPAIQSPAVENTPASQELIQAIALYRAKHYPEAMQALERLHTLSPEAIRVTYYLALSEVQCARYAQAKAHYEEVVLLAPKSAEARLAQKGLTALQSILSQDEGSLDSPPALATDQKTPQADSQQSAEAAEYAQQMQELQTLQMMMMSSGGGNNTNSMMNPMMMLPMMQQRSGGQSGTGQAGQQPANPFQGMDPNMMSQMMMNQMLQDFNFSGSDNKN